MVETSLCHFVRVLPVPSLARFRSRTFDRGSIYVTQAVFSIFESPNGLHWYPATTTVIDPHPLRFLSNQRCVRRWRQFEGVRVWPRNRTPTGEFVFHPLLPLIVEFEEAIKIDTLLWRGEVRKNPFLTGPPVVRENGQIRIAHELLSEHVQAMMKMIFPDNVRGEAESKAPVVVIVGYQTLTQSIQAMQVVYGLETANEAIWRPLEVLWCLNGISGIFSGAKDVRATDWEDSRR